MNYKLIVLIIILTFLSGCSNNTDKSSLINTKHLDHLYQEINVNNKSMAVVHIYSEYPDYHYVNDEDEGMACVDDAARAAIFYIKYSKIYNDQDALSKAKKLIEFVIHMQSDNGFFYNFIWPDYSINKKFRTSVAEPNWWSWRALWALTEAYPIFSKINKSYALKISEAIKKTIFAVKKYFKDKEEQTINIDGFIRPTWLPNKYAADQASILVLSLCNYFKYFEDRSIIGLVNRLSRGVLLMQEGDENKFPFGAIMSWKNTWHAWGNLQSYSLLKAYELTGNKKYLNAAIVEITNFYSYLRDNYFMNEFTIKNEGEKIVVANSKKYSQIAYGIRPMIYAAVTATVLTGNNYYAEEAAKIAMWFWGKNIANENMYSEKNGICYDGIISKTEINKNSGAESTVEALLSILEIENNPISKRKLFGYLNKN